MITSATIDPQRFSRHFGDAPVVEVSGRTYPVEVRYRPFESEEDDQTDAIGDAVEELLRERPGDVLVFLSGEREIRDTAEALSGRLPSDVDILPLYARLSTREQQRVFKPHDGRRIVLATNVAETSLTVPGIRYVVDPGTARISRYSARLKVQRLPIEPISQASADQRKGRCGRDRGRHLHPALLRGGLRRAPALHRPRDPAHEPRLGDPADGRRGARRHRGLPVPRPARPAPGARRGPAAAGARRARRRRAADAARPPARAAAGRPAARPDGARGRPPRLRRRGDRDRGRALDRDPRERPADKREEADGLHARFADERSDFLALREPLELPARAAARLSGNQFRKRCHAEFLHHLRVREWQDLVAQLRQAAKGVGVDFNQSPAEPDDIHLALLAGPALAHRHARPGAARVRGRARRALRALAGLGARAQAAELDDGRRARRDVAAVGADRGADRAALGRAARRAPGQAQLRRAALGAQARRRSSRPSA